MKQPIKKQIKNDSSIKKESKPQKRNVRRRITKQKHPQYGTSKLEEDFAKNFLDKLGVDYIYQFEAKDIQRFYDFFIPNKDGSYGGLLIEVDGDYYHFNENTQKNETPTRMQQKNMRVDEYKNKWAYLHGYPIMRIWESDIRKNPKEVMQRLKDRLYIIDEKIKKKGRNLGKKP